ncbi:Lrp/AsnC family transcriptional regulator [Aestuariispira insulae]|uniref:AsnC family transcriptional regulator n=1 Tax=Aestuariispira insulae TaxID=1461337 RepID=A0A3D9HG75_9PROT|nr:Lrp/AsnC family transcriptional regulator [Aestuariispira insulae]RED48502.1 AsnC family transcriptional regulator [Aestuariispira insulae]
MAKFALDAADIRILCALQQHGQLSKGRLSELVNLSPTPCWARFNRLKKAGLVRGYRADIDFGRIGNAMTVVVTVSLKHHRKADFDSFERRVRQEPAITECLATGGGMDYVLKIVTSSLSSFQQVMDGLFEEDDGIDRYMTYIATREVKSAVPDIAGLAAPKD